MRNPWIVGVSGASGTPYARALIRALLDAGEPVDLIVSRAARLTLLDETGATVRDAHWKDDVAAWLGRDLDDLAYWPVGDLAAGPSSGSYPARGMAVVPASTAACAGIAIGLSKDLLQRAAEVNLKERRRTVIVPRETPVTRSHLEHLIALHDAGAWSCPRARASTVPVRGRPRGSWWTSWRARYSTLSAYPTSFLPAGPVISGPDARTSCLKWGINALCEASAQSVRRSVTGARVRRATVARSVRGVVLAHFLDHSVALEQRTDL